MSRVLSLRSCLLEGFDVIKMLARRAVMHLSCLGRSAQVSNTPYICVRLSVRERDISSGSAASKAFQAKHGVSPAQDDLTPWCTCFGSLVCSYYAEKFNDGTRTRSLLLMYHAKCSCTAFLPRFCFDSSLNRHLRKPRSDLMCLIACLRTACGIHAQL